MFYCKHCIHFEMCKFYRRTVDYAVDDGVCLHFAKDTNVLTNADRIRAMSDDALEDFIRRIYIHFEPWCDKHCKMSGDADCNICLKNWLKQPVEVEDGQA